MYFGSSNGYSGIDARGLWWVAALVTVGIVSLLALATFGVYEVVSHLSWVSR